MRGRGERGAMLGAVGFGRGGERQELRPGFALLPLPGLWGEQRQERGAEAAPEKRGRAAYGREKITKGSWRCIITIMIC